MWLKIDFRARGPKLLTSSLILPAVCDLLFAPIDTRTMVKLFASLYTLLKVWPGR